MTSNSTEKESKTPTERITDVLINMIRRQQLRPGQNLREQALADHFGVSRGPVREALNRLASTGLVILIPGRGAQIPSPNESEVGVNSDITGMLMGLAARRAAEIGSEKQKMAIKIALKDLEDAVQSRISGRAFLYASAGILGATVKAANSDALEKLLDQVLNFGPSITWASAGVMSLVQQKRRLKLWGRMSNAIQSGEAVKAERAMLSIQRVDKREAQKAGLEKQTEIIL